MKKNLKNLTAVVTGAGRGFGEAMSTALGRQGLNVVVADLDEAEAKKVANRISTAGGRATAVRADISVASDAEYLVKTAVAEYKQIDILVNNAGILGFMGAFEDTSVEAWDATFGVNVRGHFLVTRAVLPHMIARKTGHIVNTTSGLARIGYRKGRPCTLYATTKFAMEGLTWALSVELEPHNIRVNAVAPGVAPTHFFNARERDGMHNRIVWKPDHTVGPLLDLLQSDVTGVSIDAEQWHEENGSKQKYSYRFEAMHAG